MNLQQLEKDLLVNLMLKYKVIECKVIDFVSVRASTEEWKRLAEEFNSISTVFILALYFLGIPMHSMFSHYVTSSFMLYVIQPTKCM